MEVQGIQHHMFVVAEEHFHIRHLHDLTQDLNAMWVTIYHIAEDVESILRLKVYLLHNRVEASLLTMDVR